MTDTVSTPESDPATPESVNAQEGNPESLSDPSTPGSSNIQGPSEPVVADRGPVQAESEQAVSSDDNGEEAVYEEWTVEELRDALSARGLPVSGNKAELIERLQA